MISSCRLNAQEILPESKDDPVRYLDVNTGLAFYHFSNKQFSDEHQNVGTHGATAYPQLTTKSCDGSSPYVALRTGSRFNNGFELSFGVSYRNYSNVITYYNRRNYVFPDSGHYYDRTDDDAKIKVVNHVLGLELAPTMRIYNTKIILGLLNVDIVMPTQHYNYASTTDYHVITKHSSYLGPNGYQPSDSLLIPKASYNFEPNISLKNKIYYSIYFGVEQEIPIKRYRYLIGAKGIYNGSTLSVIAYLGVRISKPYTWHKN